MTEEPLQTVDIGSGERANATVNIGGGELAYTTEPPTPEGISLGTLTADDYLLSTGGTSTLSIDVSNSRDSSYDYTIEWFEDGTKVTEETQTIPAHSVNTYTHSVSKSSPGTFDYQASSSNIVTLAWMNVNPDQLTADPYVTKPDTATTLSITVSNPASSAEDVTVEFFDVNGSKLAGTTKTIVAGDWETFTTDHTEEFPDEIDFYATVTEVGTGVSADSNTVTVTWTSAELLADWGSGLEPITPTTVASFSGWYDYHTGQAHHGNFREFGTAVQVLDDGSSAAISMTHHDADGPATDGPVYNVDTSFTFNDGSFGSYLVQDDAPGSSDTDDSYSASGMNHIYGGQRTDGAVITFLPGTDITISATGEGSDGITLWNEGVTSGTSVRIVNNR